MIKPLHLFAVMALLFIFSNANAQVDTTKLDLGRLMLDKNFTQTVTVKGYDLEKMPFDNLAEAINVWFYGSYTNAVNNVYVVDGNLVADVNAYSIYDIDEVTLVQNALTRTAGAVQQQQLILVKTKRAKGKGYGATAAVQDYLSSHYTNNINDGITPTSYQTGLKTNTTLYEQYYLSGYYNTGNIQSGISADFLRDALPAATGSGTDIFTTPDNFKRYRFNGYFSAKLGTSVLDINAGYVPEKAGGDFNITTPANFAEEAYLDQGHMFNGSVRLTTHILPNFVNVAHAAYNLDHTNESIAVNDFAPPADSAVSVQQFKYKSHTIVAYDNLSYDAKFANGWGVEPMVNLEFRALNEITDGYGSSLNNEGGGSGFTYQTTLKEHMFLLTPSINLYYKNFFNVQAGVLYNIATIGGFKNDSAKVFPFVSASLDLARLIDPNAAFSVKLYGAYSLSYFWLDDYNALGDFTNYSSTIPYMDSYYNDKLTTSYQASDNTDYKYFTRDLNEGSKSFKNISAGITISPLKTGLSFDYFFQQGAYLSPIEILSAYGGNLVNGQIVYNNTNAYLHHVAVNYTMNNSFFHWQTGLNATMLEQEYPVSFYGFETMKATIGANEWTGGWVNRLAYNDFFAGLDVLYHLGQTVYYSPLGNNELSAERINSISLQNVYLGYKLHVPHMKGLEIYANGRNLIQSKETDITDDRRYYGVGVKASL